MKFLIVGLGSMGKRRVRNLQHLGYADITGFDPRADRCDEACAKYGIQTISDWSKAQSLDVDAWIISTPPDTHLDYGLMAIDRGTAFFTEANVTDARAPEVIRRIAETGVIGAPSCTLRYNQGPRRIKKLLKDKAIGRPLSFTYQCGQFLPDWHPWESYKDFYVSKRETGACREIVPFELCWLTDIFGAVDRLSCFKDKVSDLDADIDDVYQLLLRFENRISGHLVVDVIARPAVRVFRLCCSHGTVEWNHMENVLRIWTPTGTANAYDLETIDLGAGTIETGYIHAEEPYIDEMCDFISAVQGRTKWSYTFEEDEKVLDLLRRAETSSENGTHI